MKNLLPALICLAFASLFGGCISHSSTVYADVDRTKVAFASERAGRLFYETLSKLPREQRQESENKVSLIVLNLEHKTVTGPNRFFNQAVERCDTDKDGTITEEEAAIFAASTKTVARSH